VMDNSPRTKALKLYKRQCQATYDASEEVRWLYDALGLKRESDFLPLRDSIEKVIDSRMDDCDSYTSGDSIITSIVVDTWCVA